MLDIKNNFYNDYYNWVLWLPICFIIGILLYFNYNYTLSLFVLLPFLVGVIFVKNTYKLIFIAIFTILSGYLRIQIYTKNIQTPIINEFIKNVKIEGKVYDISYFQRENKTFERIVIEVKNITKTNKKPKYIRVNLEEIDIVKYGDYVKLNANIMPIPKQFFPYSYNPEREFYYHQIGAIAYNGEIDYIFRPDKISLRERFYNVRNDINEHIISIVGERNGSLIGSFITGIRGKIATDDYNNMINAGLVHLIAISGMNMAIAMGLFYGILRQVFAEFTYLTTNYEIKKFCAFLAIIIGFLYLSITGFPVSAVRAYIMSALFFVGIIIDKQPDITRFLCFSALYILIDEPNLILDIGFQLSFLAVLSLISIFQLIKIHTNKWYLKPFFYIVSAILSTIIAEIGVAPLSIFHFNTYNPYSIIANAIAVPVSTIITMPLITASVFLFPFGLENYALIPTTYSIDFIIKLSQWTNEISTLYLIRSQSLWTLFLMLFGFLWFCLWKEKWRYFGICLFVITFFIAILEPLPNVYIEKSDNLITYISPEKDVYFSKKKSKFQLETIAKKLGKKEYKIKKIKTNPNEKTIYY
ncbi:MAG: ComEC/Rec2 family competence protein [Rickettsiales bacterium]|nr:MAG: ComEC/Rec2 family competence protein [Rickettsiales bacterium]